MARARVQREEFLQKLLAVQPGLSAKEVIEQSSCFVFQNGQVMTYNDEVACVAKSGMDGKFEGAVRAQPLLALLEKMVEDELELQTTASELLVTGKRKRAGIAMEKEILLSIGTVEKPKGWKDLPGDFCEAIGIVQECAGKDDTRFNLTCIHIHPKWVEACDNIQVTRYRLKTGVEQKSLIRRDSIKQVVNYGMTSFSETPSWVHFRNGSGLTLSCRRYLEDFPDLDEAGLFNVKGKKLTLPKGLAEAADKAGVFSATNADDDVVSIELRPGGLRIKGAGALGWYQEVKKLVYSGPAMTFLISPKLLAELIKHHSDCEVTPERLKVDGGKFVYVTCLGVPVNTDAESNGNGRHADNDDSDETSED